MLIRLHWTALRRVGATALAVAILVWPGGCGDGSAKPQAARDPQRQPAAVPPAAITQDKIEKSLVAAQQYIDSQDFNKAQAILVTLLDRAPRESRALELCGQVQAHLAMQAQERGDAAAAKTLRDNAYEQYRKVLELEPNSPQLQQSAGQMAAAAGNNAAALTHFQTAGKLDPKNPQYPLYEAQLLIKAKRFDQAIAALGRVLTLDPDEAFAHASLAMIAMEQQKYDEALRHIGAARRILPDDVGMRAQEARIHRRMGDPKRALELLIGLSDSERAQELVAFEIAASYDQLGQQIQAARAWEHVFKFNPTAPRAWLAAVRVSEALLKAGEREQAALWLQQAQMAAPGAAEVKALEAAFSQG